MISPTLYRWQVITLVAGAAISLAAGAARAQAVQTQVPASSEQRWNPDDAPRPRLHGGLDPQTRAQIDQSARIQERIRQIGLPADGIPSWQEAALNGDSGQSAKFGMAWRLHRWGTVVGMAAGYLLWTAFGLAILSLLGRTGRHRGSGR